MQYENNTKYTQIIEELFLVRSQTDIAGFYIMHPLIDKLVDIGLLPLQRLL